MVRCAFSSHNHPTLVHHFEARPIALDGFSAFGKWQGADGNVWVAEPDGAAVDVNLSAPGFQHYDAHWSNDTPMKYKIYIGLSTSTTSTDLTTDVPEVCVGQQVNFSLNGLPGNVVATDMVGHWQLPTKYVNEPWQQTNWVVTDPITGGGYWQPYGSVNYRIDPNLLQNTAQTSCWFVNGTGGHVGVNLNLHFDNGQYASVAADGNIIVVRPKISLIADANITPSFFTAGWYSYYVQLGGDGDPRPDNHWMGYSIKYDAGKYSGTGGIAQLLTMDYSAPWLTPLSYPSFSDWWLDGDSEMYSSGSVTPANGNLVPFDDEPAHGHTYSPWGTIRCKASFKDYCMFQPDGGIPVTIGIVTWQCDGESPDVGILSVNSIIGPNGPDGSDDFPVWENNFSEGSKGLR
jgi:hypothetical protein